MSLKEQMAADAGLFVNIEDFGEAAVCTPLSGPAFSLPVLVGESVTTVGGQVVAIEDEVNMVCAVADLQELAGGEKFTLADGREFVYNATNHRYSDGVFWRLKVSREPRGVPKLRY